ncbi:MAG: caspase family protein [Nannocystaceae bacterium]|nr:caspase family protein [Nannocystaceae bacterium]
MMRSFPYGFLTWITVALWAVALWAFCPASALAAEPTETAQVAEVRRFALVVGANNGGPGRVQLLYAVDDADAVSKVLVELGGLHDGDRSLLRDPSPAQLLAEIRRLSKRIQAARSSGASTQFFFYYSGHSDEGGLLLGSEQIEYRALRTAIDGVPADVRLAILDSCASGAFTRLKGGKKRAPFLVGASADVKGHAFLTSSSADETAQESDRVGGSYFTHFLTTGLRGAADADGDKQVTLGEAYEFAFDETLAQTEASLGGAQHAAYDINLTGSGDLVLTDLRHNTARLELSSDIGGRVFVRRVGGELAAELYKPAGSAAVLLALEPGLYQVTVDDGTTLRRANKDVRARGRVVLAASEMREIERETTTARGSTKYEDVFFNVGLLPPLSINGQLAKAKRIRDTEIRNTMSVSLVWGRSGAVDGVAMSLGGSYVRGNVEGAQLSLLANVAKGKLDGAQLSNGANIAGSVRGAQFGTYNHANAMQGFQAGMVNFGRDVRGVQAGMVNVGRQVQGVQVGLFAFADSADAQIALFSGTREHGVHPSLYTSDTSLHGVALRFPAKRTYSEIIMALHPMGARKAWTFGLAFGVHTPLAHRLFVDVDLASLGVANGPGFRLPLGLMSKLRVMVGWQPYERLAVFGGPTVAFMANRISDTERETVRPGYGWATTVHEGSFRARMWPGFIAGLRF